MVWLEYEHKNTFFHNRLTGLTKLIMTLVIIFMAGFYWDLRYLGVLLLFTICLALLSKIPWHWYRNLLIVVLLMTPASIQLGSLWMVRSEYFKVLPREFTSKVIIHIGKLPVVGETALTYGNAYWTASFIIKIFISIMALYFFIYTTSVSDLSYSLQKLGIPSSIIFLISCSYRFIPLMLRRQQIVTWARSLRGWRIGKNPIKVIYNVGPIFFSLGLSAYNAVEQTTRAVSLKGFDVKKKTTPIRDIKFTYIDYVLSLFFIAVFAISTYLNLVYNIGNI